MAAASLSRNPKRSTTSSEACEDISLWRGLRHMHRVVFILALTTTLAGCGLGQDNSICTVIPSTTLPDDGSDTGGREGMIAEACVHRQAYRLSRSSDPAEIVARAAIEACEQPIDTAARLSARYTHDTLRLNDEDHIDVRIEQIKEGYERLALLKVVEGRAGKCRA